MKKCFFICYVSVFLLFSVALQAEVYLWPIYGERRLSSSFSEYREGHFHSGIDIRTYGRSGFPCLAIGKGEVRRIKIEPYGYGKALYFELEDGKTAVYAHLRCFNYQLDSLVYYHRLKSGSSWCDIHLPPGRFEYSVGDTLAFSGRSGTKAPHLHFEIRDNSDRPINPLEGLYSIPDNSPPVISGIRVIPLDWNSRVNGKPIPLVSYFKARDRDRYQLDDTLQVQGKTAFAVSVWDEQGYGDYKMAPFSLELIIDGNSVYKAVNRKFSFTQTSEIILEYSIEKDNASGRYTNLFYKHGKTREDRIGDGYIHSDSMLSEGLYLESGLHRAEVKVIDDSRNSTVGEFKFWFHKYPEIDVAKELHTVPEVIVKASDPDGGEVEGKLFHMAESGKMEWDKIELESLGDYYKGSFTESGNDLFRYSVSDDEGMTVEHYFSSPEPVETSLRSYSECTPVVRFGSFILRVITDQILACPPDIGMIKDGDNGNCDIVQTGPKNYMVKFSSDGISDGLNIFKVSGRDYRGFPLHTVSAFKLMSFYSGDSVRVELSNSLPIVFFTPAMYEESFCYIKEVTMPGSLDEGIIRVSPAFRLDIQPESFRLPLHLKLGLEPKIILLKWDGHDAWECEGVPSMERGVVKLKESGIYVFSRDRIPPLLDTVKIETREKGSGFYRAQTLYVPASDRGAGIDPYSAEVLLNGEDIVCEWDAIREVLYIPVPFAISAGKVKMSVELSDGAGNRTVRDYSFMLR